MISEHVLKEWQKACDAYEIADYDAALKIFIGIADNAKLHFNIGLLFAAIDDHERALVAYKRAVAMDPHFAVAYFQMGVSLFILEHHDRAIDQFDMAYKNLRGNAIINYEQLGMRFRLYKCEVCFNRGICKLSLKDGKAVNDGLEDLYKAKNSKMTDEHDVIDQAVNDNGKGYSVFSIPPHVLFRPRLQKKTIPKDGLIQLTGDRASTSNHNKPPIQHTSFISRTNSVTPKSFWRRKLKKDSTSSISAMSPAASATVGYRPPSRPDTPDHARRKGGDSPTYRTPQEQLTLQTHDLYQNHHGTRQYSPIDRPQTDTGMTALSHHFDDIPHSASTASTTSFKSYRRIDSGFDSSYEDRYSSSSSTGRSSTRSHKALQDSPPPPVPQLYRGPTNDTCDDLNAYDDGAYDDVMNTMNNMSVDGERYRIRERLLSNESSGMARRGSANSNSSSTGRAQTPLPPASSVSHSSKDSSRLKVKVHFTDTRILLVSADITVEELTNKIREKYRLESSIQLKYMDEEDDKVDIVDDEDLNMAKQYALHRTSDSSRKSTRDDQMQKLEIWVSAP